MQNFSYLHFECLTQGFQSRTEVVPRLLQEFFKGRKFLGFSKVKLNNKKGFM